MDVPRRAVWSGIHIRALEAPFLPFVRQRTEKAHPIAHAAGMTATTIDTDALLALGQALQQAGYQFTTVTPATHRRVNGRPQNAWAQDVYGVFGWSRPFRENTLPSDTVTLMRRAGVLVEREDGLCATVRASTIGTRLYFHSAFPTRAQDAVFFGPDTYR